MVMSDGDDDGDDDDEPTYPYMYELMEMVKISEYCISECQKFIFVVCAQSWEPSRVGGLTVKKILIHVKASLGHLA